MKKTILLSLILVFLISPFSLIAKEMAIIQEKKGKVDVMVNGKWLAATEGMKVKVGTTISTGFNSSAIIDLGDSTLTISQLSRMTIEKLEKEKGLTKTALYLRTGKVKADVRSTAKLKHNFQFKSSVATASVRGTSFTFTPSQLNVHEGAVQYSNNTGQQALVIIGQDATADNSVGIVDQKDVDYFVPSGNEDAALAIEPQSENGPSMGSISINVEYEE